MKPILLPLAATWCLSTLGCRSLPPLRASEIHSTTSALGIHVSADATGVSVTDRTLRATNVKWSVTFPGFSHVTTAKDYSQALPNERETK
jgi:hypothetical protein